MTMSLHTKSASFSVNLIEKINYITRYIHIDDTQDFPLMINKNVLIVLKTK